MTLFRTHSSTLQTEVQKGPTMLTTSDLEAMIGQPINTTEVEAILNTVPGKKKREKDGDDVYHTYRDYGLVIVEDVETKRISGIFLEAKSRSSAEYGGEAPHGILFAHTKADVRSNLGEPDKENGENEDQWDRGRFRFGVIYDRKKGTVSNLYYSAL